MKSVYIYSITIVVVSISISCDKDEFTPFYSREPGLEWETRSIGFATNLNDIAYSGNSYVAIGDSSIFYSNNAFDWNISYANAPGELYRVHWTGDKFVTVGDGCILVSSSGLHWKLTEVDGSINDVCSIDDIIVAVGDSGRSLRSSDGIIWSVGNHGFTSFAVFASKGYVDGDFIVGGPWVQFRYSEDGNDWPGSNWPYDDPRYSNPYDSNYVRSMTLSNGQIVAVGDSGKTYGLHRLFDSEDIAYADLHKVVSAHNRIITIGDNGTILMSDLNWNHATRILTSQTNLNLRGATSTDLGFIVVGDSGIVISSPINKP